MPPLPTSIKLGDRAAADLFSNQWMSRARVVRIVLAAAVLVRCYFKRARSRAHQLIAVCCFRGERAKAAFPPENKKIRSTHPHWTSGRFWNYYDDVQNGRTAAKPSAGSSGGTAIVLLPRAGTNTPLPCPSSRRVHRRRRNRLTRRAPRAISQRQECTADRRRRSASVSCISTRSATAAVGTIMSVISGGASDHDHHQRDGNPCDATLRQHYGDAGYDRRRSLIQDRKRRLWAR